MRINLSRSGTLLAAIPALLLTTATAVASTQPDIGTPASAARSGSSRDTFPLFAQSSQCINGYRTIHVVRGQGRVGQGVILRCRN